MITFTGSVKVSGARFQQPNSIRNVGVTHDTELPSKLDRPAKVVGNIKFYHNPSLR
ncbi:MAG: hypothetical protein PVG70_09320 [Desulfobacterales bacterium]